MTAHDNLLDPYGIRFLWFIGLYVAEQQQAERELKAFCERNARRRG